MSAEARAQVDSLWNVFKHAKHDTTRIKTYLKIGDVYEYENPDSALLYYNKALGIANVAFSSPSGGTEPAEVTPFTKNKIFSLKATSLMYIGIIHKEQGSYDKALEYYLKSLKIFEELQRVSPFDVANKKEMSRCYGNIGNVHWNQGSYDKAIEYFLKSLKIFKELNNKKGMSTCFGNIGNVHWSQGSYPQAIEYYLKALKIDEELNDKKGISTCYQNIGNVHYEQGNYTHAIEYYLKSFKIREELDDKRGMSTCYNNIGIIHYEQGSNAQAIEYYLKALKISEELQDKKGMSHCYNNIGNVYSALGNYVQAIEYLLKALKIFEELNNKNGIALVYGSIASLHIDLADSTALTENQKINYLNLAIDYGLKSLNLAKEIGALPWENSASNTLMKAYKKLANFKKAIEYAEIFITTKDSMFSEEKTKSLTEMGAKYEAEKKQLLIENLNKENALKQAELAQSEEKRNKQLILIYSFVAGFIIILVFSIIIFRLFVQKKKANVLLAMQKQQIEIQNAKLNQANEEITAQRDEITAQRDLVTEQKNHIEEQKKEIEDSIRYAKRIQTAVLPATQFADNILGKHFTIFRPKDVVSGDFYWAAKINEWLIVTVADCTGHGVPGAFMSMLGVSFLNELVRKKEITKASDILGHLRNSIIEALQQKGTNSDQKDGMDMSLVAINKNNRQGQWAGAYNPLWIIKQLDLNREYKDTADIVKEIKADKMPIAVHIRMDNFTNHEIQLETGDRLYLFSDGLPDQFGGPDGKKFLYKRFKTILAQTAGLTMKEQGEQIEKELDNWMAGYETKYKQVDDITIVGLMI